MLRPFEFLYPVLYYAGVMRCMTHPFLWQPIMVMQSSRLLLMCLTLLSRLWSHFLCEHPNALNGVCGISSVLFHGWMFISSCLPKLTIGPSQTMDAGARAQQIANQGKSQSMNCKLDADSMRPGNPHLKMQMQI